MGWTILTHKAGPVKTEDHIHALQCCIMYKIVISSLHERRVYVTERQHTALCKTCREGHGMALGNTHVKETVGIHISELMHGASCRHSRSDADNFVILHCHLHECLTEDILETGSTWIGNNALAGLYVKKTRLMP